MAAEIKPTEAAQPLLAAAWMMGAVAAFTLMAVAGRAVSLELDTFEILGYRSAIGIVVIGAIIAWNRNWQAARLDHPGLHLGRNLIHFTAQNLWFYAIFTIPLAQVFALEFTAPIWVLILSPFFLGENLTRTRVIAAICGFVGTLLVAQPGSVPITPGLIAAAACAFGFGLTYIMTKKLTGVTGTTTILWWMVVMQTAFGFIAAGVDGDIALPTAQSLPWVGILGVTGLAAHFCIARALRVAPATVVMPFDFLRLPVIAFVGLFLYDEPLGLLVILGGALILGGNYVNLRAEAKTRAT